MKTLKTFLIFILLITSLQVLLPADVGVIIPLNRGNNKPDEKILSMDRMYIDVVIDNGYATTNIVQVFHNHTSRDLEGQYMFVIPSSALISDFAVWDDNVRIPGVILEKKRARKIYEEIVQTMRDPGLLESTDDASEMHHFKARIFPIPAGGTKRLEIQYTEKLQISDLVTYFTLPLKPAFFEPQSCRVLKTDIKIISNHTIKNLKLYKSPYKLKIKTGKQNEHLIEGMAQKVKISENISFEYTSDVKGVHTDFLTYRNAQRYIYDPDPYHGYKYKDKKGYFLSNIIFNLPPSTKLNKGRDLVIMLDVSLSMKWKRLVQAYTALEYFIKKLKPGDRLQVILFNDEVKIWEKAPLPYSPQRAEKALMFVQNSYLTGGTDLLAAVTAGLKQIKDNPHVNEPYLLVITDGHPTMNELRYKEITNKINQLNLKWKKDTRREYLSHIYVYGIGDKTNTILLKNITLKNEGFFTWVTDTEEQDFKLRSLLEKIGADIITDIKMTFPQDADVSLVYPEKEQSAFNKTSASIAGTYKSPGKNIVIQLTGKKAGELFTEEIKVTLPESDLKHKHIPRMWAKARIDKLLELINYEGEKDKWVNEIIALAKQYKFVTPYTSFLAAPRSLLRPRVIKPGDPVLRIKTDPAIVSVVAQFPFGLIKPLRFIKDEDIWEVRFLAPKEMNDGKYKCTLILKDIEGNTYKEHKFFVIDSKAPQILPVLDKKQLKAGEVLTIKARSDADTKNLYAKLGFGLPVPLRYKSTEKASTGTLIVPENIPSGNYKLKFFAEDFAHNNSTIEVDVEIIGR